MDLKHTSSLNISDEEIMMIDSTLLTHQITKTQIHKRKKTKFIPPFKKQNTFTQKKKKFVTPYKKEENITKDMIKNKDKRTTTTTGTLRKCDEARDGDVISSN